MFDESYWTVVPAHLKAKTVTCMYAVQGDFNFWDWYVWPFMWELYVSSNKLIGSSLFFKN